MNDHARRLEELQIDLDLTEHHFKRSKSKEAKQALNNLREILIVASHDLSHRFNEEVSDEEADAITEDNQAA